MKKLGIFGGVILSAALMVGSAGTVLASGSESDPAMTATAQGEQIYQGIFGTVIDADTDGDGSTGPIKLETKSLGEVEVILDGETIYKVPGQEDASIESIAEDSRLAILAIPEEEQGVYTAVKVMLVPEGATYRHMHGVVVATQEKTMTMMNNSGETWQVNLPEGVQGGAVGELVSVAVQNSAGEGPYVASGLQTATAVQTRLQAQLNELADQGAGAQAQVQNREQLMEQLGEQFEGLTEQHMQILKDVQDKAPLEAQEAIQAMIENLEQTQLQFSQAAR